MRDIQKVNKEMLKKAIGYIAVIVVFAFILIGSWKIRRWANWKFSYGTKVEVRIEQLEVRVSALEGDVEGDGG